MNITKMFAFGVCLFVVGEACAAPKRNEQQPKQVVVSNPSKQVRASGNLHQPQYRK